MLFVQDQNPATFVIKQFSPTFVQVNETVYMRNVIIMPHKIISPWTSKTFHELGEKDFQVLFAETMDIVLLGVGEQSERLPLALYHCLLEKKMTMECMSLAAACRTYSILSAEGRNVAAALLLSST